MTTSDTPNLNARIRATFSNPTPFISAGILALYTTVICLIILGIGITTASLLMVIIAALPIGFIIGLWMNRIAYQRTAHILSTYITTMEQVALGDLMIEFHLPDLAPNSPETAMLARLVDTTNEMLKRIRRVLIGVSNALTRLDTDTQAILEATSKQIIMTNEQDSVVTETTATVNEVRATVTETAERAQSVAETAQISVDISKSGIDAVNQTIAGMQLIRKRVEDIADNILVLSEHTQQIGEIIATVNSLADQSRMLALNASVEAARAGEEGKGFAVVAMEVRNLADQNRDATIQVREILGEIQRATNAAVMVTEEGSKGVDAGQKLVNSAGDAIRNLARAIEEAAMAALQIAASTRQQTIGMDQLTHAMRTIKHATGETVSGTMQVEASVQRLRDAAYLVNNLLADLKLG